MLYDIITELAQELGRDLNKPSDRSWILSQVNHAAREIYDTDTIVGCEREKIFTLGVEDQQVALPWYVDRCIGVRDYDLREAIEQVDMRPRYMNSAWSRQSQQYPYRQWRIKGESALSKNLLDEASLTISLPDGTTAPRAFSVTIVGSNSQSARLTEVVNFAAGDRTKTTDNFFAEVFSIMKTEATTYDLTVTDVQGREVSSIPSHLKRAAFMLLQVMDRGESKAQTQLVEILYKQRFELFVNDTDSFTAGDSYDKCIYWKTLEHIYAKQDGKEDKAAMCGNKAQVLLANIISNRSEIGRAHV